MGDFSDRVTLCNCMMFFWAFRSQNGSNNDNQQQTPADLLREKLELKQQK